MARVKGGENVNKYLRQIADRLSKASEMHVGFLAKSRYPDGKPVAMIAMIQDSGAPSRGIPPRPFFRNMIANNEAGWAPIIKQALIDNGYDSEKALRVLGEVMVGQLKQSIQDTNDPPLKPSTIKHKGFAKPLIDTGHMQNSIDYEIIKKS